MTIQSLVPHQLKIAAVLVVLCVPAFAAEIRDFSARYEVRSHGLKVGELQRQLTVEADGRYHFESRLQPTGLFAMVRSTKVEESSSGEIIAGALRPSRYVNRKIDTYKRRESVIDFDWERSQINATLRGVAVRLPVKLGTLDKLAYQIALASDVQNKQSALAYEVADDGRVKSYRWERIGEETIEIGHKPVPTEKVTYGLPTDRHQTSLWLAPSYRYLPVKIEYRENDDITTAVMTDFD